MWATAAVLLALSCPVFNDTDSTEYYYAKHSAASADACCALCTADKTCSSASFAHGTCYMKDAITTTPVTKEGVTLLVINPQPPATPTPRPTPPPTPPGTIFLSSVLTDQLFRLLFSHFCVVLQQASISWI
jgi:hypothetical protein